ncbi:hypothetical protein MCC01966_15700 [Bifidobacteriaceae bacterium MCC01966]|nr:hypothetical protein MCC01966_15700 [Bifidobacteriaceae bacterium MCC01966]
MPGRGDAHGHREGVDVGEGIPPARDLQADGRHAWHCHGVIASQSNEKSGGANITGALDVPAEYSRPMQCGQIRENPAT